ncbi:TetR/AcrR family transcriptional regulator [Ornithinibacillus gellani]|uniref:forespore capture DNA-binding protein RefZ n=1 Tax=Ornithinibacillus gellani TaxID=2293253 RepID=UPI000F4AA718|nr:forespore capture DNA-binding protein RefZ [Ornithinibacillus gellani]TQS76289.1 TetR/AcrR family transcriptional regulator [Ornithinibacillus gellani]
MTISPTKQKVMDAASSLFYQKGFHGTSVRDIAEKADVNVSLISYYFKGKQGLLEFAVTSYYEAYLKELEDTWNESVGQTAFEQLKKIIFTIIHYKASNHQFSCFIHRELSLDSIFVREMAVTYLAKEHHIISNAFFQALREANHGNTDYDILLLQLKGMIAAPYILEDNRKNQPFDDYGRNQFVNRYVKTIHDWLGYLVNQQITI